MRRILLAFLLLLASGAVPAQEPPRPLPLPITVLLDPAVTRVLRLAPEQAARLKEIAARDEADRRQAAAVNPEPEALRRRTAEIERHSRDQALALLSPEQRADAETLEDYHGLRLPVALALLRVPGVDAAQRRRLAALGAERAARKLELFYAVDLADTEAERNAAREELRRFDAATRERVAGLLSGAQQEHFRKALAAGK